MSEELKYGPDIQYGHLFGRGTDYLTRSEYEKLTASSSLEEVIIRARQLGWSHACPVAKELSDPERSPYGPLWIAERYSDVNSWFKLISKTVYQKKPQIYQQLVSPIRRLPDEPVGKHEPESVPQSHLEQLSPMSGPVGYALPRVVIEYAGRGINAGDKGAYNGTMLLTDALRESTNPAHLLAVLSEMVVVRTRKEPVDLLQHSLAISILEEENCHSLVSAVVREFEDFAPNVWRAYVGLSTSERQNLEIIDL